MVGKGVIPSPVINGGERGDSLPVILPLLAAPCCLLKGLVGLVLFFFSMIAPLELERKKQTTNMCGFLAGEEKFEGNLVPFGLWSSQGATC
jgi:hypothetical protein